MCDDPIAHKKRTLSDVNFLSCSKWHFFSCLQVMLIKFEWGEPSYHILEGKEKDEIENYCLVPEIQWIVKAIESEMLYMFMGAIEINFKEISYTINIPHNRYRFLSFYFNNFIPPYNDSLVWVALCVYKIKLNEPERVCLCSHINFTCTYVLSTEGISFIKLKIIIMFQS